MNHLVISRGSIGVDPAPLYQQLDLIESGHIMVIVTSTPLYTWIDRPVSIDGQRLREVRTARQETQRWLASRTNVSAALISLLETGRVSRVRRSTALALATALEIELREISTSPPSRNDSSASESPPDAALAGHSFPEGGESRQPSFLSISPRRLRDARYSLGLAQVQLAHGASIHPSYIAQIETGRKLRIGLEIARRIAHALELTVNDLAQDCEMGQDNSSAWALCNEHGVIHP